MTESECKNHFLKRTVLSRIFTFESPINLSHYFFANLNNTKHQIWKANNIKILTVYNVTKPGIVFDIDCLQKLI